MNGIKNMRLLKAGEIECRVAAVNENGLSLLLFKDARVDQKILDEACTPFGWRRSHQSIDGNLYCTVEIWDDEKKQWIGKQDVGTMSDYEKEKGQASDSFKRACFNWGIGRELYTAPFIWIPAAMADIRKKGQKYVSGEHFTVRSVTYDRNREIESLEIVNSRGQTVYSLQKGGDSRRVPCQEHGPEPDAGRKARQESGQGTDAGISRAQEVVLMAELNRTGVPLQAVLDRYGIRSLSQMTPEICHKAVAALRQTKPKAKPAGTAA